MTSSLDAVVNEPLEHQPAVNLQKKGFLKRTAGAIKYATLAGLAYAVISLANVVEKVEAFPVRVDLRGEVVGVYNHSHFPQIKIGDIIQGYFTYDTTAGHNTNHKYGEDREFYTQSFSNQHLYGISLQLMLEDGSYTFENREDSLTFDLSVCNDVYSMKDAFSIGVGDSSLYRRGDQISIYFEDSTKQVFDNTDLPAVFPTIDKWTSNEMNIWWGQSPLDTRIDFRITEVHGEPIPEPSTIVVLGLGTLVLLNTRKYPK